jgi:hypothetical protein
MPKPWIVVMTEDQAVFGSVHHLRRKGKRGNDFLT